MELSELSEKINEMVMQSIKHRYMTELNMNLQETDYNFNNLSNRMEELKAKHTFMLRPNLANPACEAEFKELNAKETARLKEYIQEMEKTRVTMNDFTERICLNFFKCMLNNFEFLVIYYDKLYLYEDFNKLPGGKP